MNNTKKLVAGFFLSIIIFGIFILPFAIFNLSFAKFLLSKIPYLIISGVISLFLSFIYRKNKILGALLVLIILSFISFILITIKNLETEDSEKVEWNSPNDNFTTNFIVGKTGHIYINAKINDLTGLFLFDTGAELSLANEKFVTDKKMKLHSYTITDAKGIKQTKNLFKVKLLELGTIEIKRLRVYPIDSLSWTDPKGIFYLQDSIIGVIGNNIISKFIWDFDLINKQVTISNSKLYCNNIPDSLAINLVPKDNHKEIPVLINGENKMLTLDFGSGFPVSLTGSIPNHEIIDRNRSYSQKTKSALAHLDSINGKESNFDFVNIKLGAFEFKEVKCFKNDSSALLGIPFIWSFKRVVVDFGNDKVYFISKNDNSGDFGVNKYNRQSVWNADGIIESKSKPEGMTFISEKDSTRIKYILYGSIKLYKNNNRLDSIFFSDSVLLPNNMIQYGPSTLRLDY